MKALRQLIVIARTEFHFGFRRGGPVVVMAVIGLVLGAGLLLGPIHFLSEFHPDPTRLTQAGYTLDAYRHITREIVAQMAAFYITMGWQLTLLLSLFLLPLGTAATLPDDHRYGVTELLHSLPLGGSIYLAGKILGVMATALFIGACSLALALAVLEGLMLAVLGLSVPADLVRFTLELAFLDGLPLIVWGGVVGVLAGTPFRTRRGAVGLAMLLCLASLAFWFLVFHLPTGALSLNPRLSFIDLAAYFVFQQNNDLGQAALAKLLHPGDPFFFPGLLSPGSPILPSSTLILMYAIWLAALVFLLALGRLWLMRKENF